ncbi:MAG: FAD binding domain-containing protein [Aggregatilineales bacterium]
MLINLRTTHRPASLSEALALLARHGARPLYGGGLVRENSSEVSEAVDLSTTGLARIDTGDGTLTIGGAATLEAIRAACADLSGAVVESLAEVCRNEMPLTLRNALALGDVLTEARPTSLLRTWLTALGSRAQLITRPIGSDGTHRLIESLRVKLDVPAERAGWGWAKVSRTPADAPIVVAIAWLEGDSERIAVGGLLLQPTLYTPGMPAQYDDYLGSVEYRTAIAPILVRRARDQAIQRRG